MSQSRDPRSRFGRESRLLRPRNLVVLLAVLVSTTACSPTDLPRFGMPYPADTQGWRILHLWQTLWIAAFCVGGLVIGLILWAVIFHRRSRMGEVPAQVRYNVPIEIAYVIIPLMMVLTIFYFTARDESKLTALTDNPQNHVGVVAFRWSWTFNYVDENAYDVGTPTQQPTLWLPINQTTQFDVTSPDVIHSFWVPDFLFKRDVIPGHPSSFDLTPNRLGTYAGRCAELCGVDHSRMLFQVKVVTQAEYAAHIAALKAQGQSGQLITGRAVPEGNVPGTAEAGTEQTTSAGSTP